MVLLENHLEGLQHDRCGRILQTVNGAVMGREALNMEFSGLRKSLWHGQGIIPSDRPLFSADHVTTVATSWDTHSIWHNLPMCGRNRISRRKQIIAEHFEVLPDDDDWTPCYNIARTQPVPIIRQSSKGTTPRSVVGPLGSHSLMGEGSVRFCGDD
jgi:hypothetical protein